MSTINQARMSPIDQARLDLMHRYWNAANYLTIGQIYLQENPRLREPLQARHITNSNRLGNVFEVENRCSIRKVLSSDDQTPDAS